MPLDKNDAKDINLKELESTPIEDKGLKNLLIGKSHLGDFGRSLGVFGFYIFIIFIGAAVLAGKHSASAGAAGAIGFVSVLGAAFSIPAALIYFGILFLLEH